MFSPMKSLSPWSMLCDEIRSRFDADVGWIAWFDVRARRFVRQYTDRETRDICSQLYAYSHIDDNLWLQRGVVYPAGVPITHHELIGPGFYETRFFHDLVEPCGLHQGLSYIIDKGRDFHVVLAGFRHAHRRDFIPSEIVEGGKLADRVRSEWGTFLGLSCRSEASLSQAVLDALPYPWLVVDSDLFVHLVHKSVRLGLPPIFELFKGKLRVPAASSRAIELAVLRALAPHCERSCRTIMSDGVQHRISFEPLKGEYVLITVRRTLSGGALAELLEKRHALSPAQAALAVAIHRIRRFAGAVRHCELTFSVAREQREAISAKLGARDFVELVALLDQISLQA